ncbi:hypothetical protein AMAG_00755 [Allomyces macrogynus ATCC 38327]|uniref:Uncharacterized protein n=1 Tax=Allomyces macrogynus (strain ATCC 38327) TaxID=578462 RepID=A0A0L0RWM3_ALLM3|nr:hypothetical protein AMAG_00755 [Allomyces macrogynus ATCC 38327]|eukprot:KNE54802.1 hypothetical protein AMAG_00755 [Allomyces macrogynus ATCC 38327]
MTTLTLDDPASSPLPPADSITSSNDPATAAAPVAKDNVSNPRPRRRSLAGAHNAPRPASWTATRTVVLVVVVAVCWQAAASLTAQWTHEHGLWLAASAVEASVAPVAGSAALLVAADAASDGHHPANLPRPPPVSATTLRIMTYNFFLRPPFVSDYHGDSKGPATLRVHRARVTAVRPACLARNFFRILDSRRCTRSRRLGTRFCRPRARSRRVVFARRVLDRFGPAGPVAVANRAARETDLLVGSHCR